ncbi:MAG: hypothetical protein JKY71_05000 [Alphaproteobacteria bacterium]|nr:hypothetical protein [Alphaproteobacteria bacterium]
MGQTTADGDIEAEALQHASVHRCIVRGESSDGEPFQRVYVTYDADEAERFNDLMGLIEHEQGITKQAIAQIAEHEFPGLILILEQHGNEITEDVPDSLPIGEGYWDEQNHVQLLRRALMATEYELQDSVRKSANEIASNIPTLMAIGMKGDWTYWAAGAAGAYIAGAIGFRGYRQNNRFNRALKIFVEFKNNQYINPDMAKEVLDKRMRSSGLLFSGVPEADLSKFDENHYIAVADKRGLWYNKNFLTKSVHRRALPNGRERIFASPEVAKGHCRKAMSVAGHFLWEQVVDLKENPTSKETWKNIGSGMVDSVILAYEFRNTVSRDRAYKDMVNAHPELGPITVEEHEHVRDAADHNILEEIRVTKRDIKEQKVDGAVMGSAFVAESIFMGTHAYEAAHAGHEIYQEQFGEAAAGTTGPHPAPEHSWIDEPEVALGLSLYSIALASGAYAYLGREISSVKDTLQSRRARVLKELYPKAMEQYRAHMQSDAEADHPEAGL